MRTYVNLAQRPFTNRRLVWLIVIAVILLSLWWLLWIGTQRSVVSAQIRQREIQIESQDAIAKEAARKEEERKRRSQQVVLPERDALQLAAARQLIAQKKFSWNRLVTDIENYLPKKARILSIRISEVYDVGEGVRGTIEVKGAGATSAEMTEMMTSLEKSGGVFQIEQASQDATSDNGEVPFSLRLIYTPSRGETQ
jgi:hypothetical protein